MYNFLIKDNIFWDAEGKRKQTAEKWHEIVVYPMERLQKISYNHRHRGSRQGF